MFTAPKIADTAGREARAMVSAAVFDREFDLAARYHGIAGQLALVADLCGDCDYSAARKIFERASSALCHYNEGLRYADGCHTFRRKALNPRGDADFSSFAHAETRRPTKRSP